MQAQLEFLIDNADLDEQSRDQLRNQLSAVDVVISESDSDGE